MSYKQVILCRTDLKMPPGKLAAQVAHAAVSAALKATPKVRQTWLEEGAAKIVLKVVDDEDLKHYKKKASKLPSSLITDAGRTFFKGPTKTCLAIGPAKDEEIDRVVEGLKLL